MENFLHAHVVITGYYSSRCGKRFVCSHPRISHPGRVGAFGGALFPASERRLSHSLLSLILVDVFTGFTRIPPIV